MGTEIIKSYGILQSELEQARSSLKGVDENIKRLIGRDPSEIIPRPGAKRGLPNEESPRGRPRVVSLVRNRSFNNESEEPQNKRRNISVFKRLSERPVHYDDETIQHPQKQLISKVIVTPREVPSRQEALAAQKVDEKSNARNRRMFGALLGTLQKFQQEETKLKSKEQKRAQVEKKIEEHEIREKAEIRKERQELFFNRKKKQAEIKMIELKMTRMKEYTAWVERQKPRANFILTKAKPHICYLPRRLNDASKVLLENSKADVEKLLEKRKDEVFAELKHIEERLKRNFEQKKQPKDAIQPPKENESEFDAENKEDIENNIGVVENVNENSNCSEIDGPRIETCAEFDVTENDNATQHSIENHSNSHELIEEDKEESLDSKLDIPISSDSQQQLASQDMEQDIFIGQNGESNVVN